MFKIFALIIWTSLCLSQNTSFIRTPSLSPDGTKLTFSYGGDVWIVDSNGGNAHRLTAHEGYDAKPIWSPNGKRIAFLSDRYGNDDVFSMSADGTDVRRHTFHSSNDQVITWQDNENILFVAQRAEEYHWVPEVYIVSINESSPEKFLQVNAIDGYTTQKGEFFYVNGYNHKWRKRYRGATNNDIFSFDGKTFKQHTKFRGNDLFPMVMNGRLYYISEEKSGIFNLVSKTLGGNNLDVLTSFKDEGVRFASISADGKSIVLAVGLDTYKYDTSTNKLNKIEIHTSDDLHGKDLTFQRFSSGASEMKVSPNGKEIAFVYKGEIYTYKPTEKKNGRLKRITESLGKEHSIVWGKESKVIYYLSDKDGQMDIYQVEPKDKSKPFYLNRYFKTTRLTNTEMDESNLGINPNRDKLSFVRGLGDFYTYQIAKKSEERLVEGWTFGGYSWSPDGKFIAYSKANNNFNSDVFIISIDRWKICKCFATS